MSKPSETLTLDQQSRILELHALAAVARDDPFGEGVWPTLCPMTLFGDLIRTTYTLTDAGRAKLDAGMAKLTPEQKAEFLAKGLGAEFLSGGQA